MKMLQQGMLFKNQNMKKSRITNLKYCFYLYEDKNNPLQGNVITETQIQVPCFLFSPCYRSYWKAMKSWKHYCMENPL